MEDINNWLSFSMYENCNHNSAIRKFCPARMEQERGDQWWDEALLDDIELCSQDASSTHLASSEVDDFVDSLIINMDHYENDESKSLENNENFADHFPDDFGAFDFYSDVPVMMEEDELEMSENSVMVSKAPPQAEEVTHVVDQGLNLVHMLLACAEAVGCRDTQLANSILSKIWTSAGPWGTSLQRVSYCFATGLKCRLSMHKNVSANSALKSDPADAFSVTREAKLEAFKLLYQTTPYIAFGFMAANEAICQAAKGKSSLHIVELGMEDTLQWHSLIRALTSRPEGPPKLRITGLTNDSNVTQLEASMKALVGEAFSSGISLEFSIISEPITPSLFTKESLNLREGEALFVNSIMQLHTYGNESKGSLKTVLKSIKELGPTAFTVIEQDANHNGPFFLGRFLESLHYYSAIFDSLEACLPRNSAQRMKIERLRFAEEISNIVAYEGQGRIERHERADKWRRQLGRAGFHVMGLKGMSQARMMISVYGCDGYTLASEKGCLLLGWKGRPILMASAWQVQSAMSS